MGVVKKLRERMGKPVRYDDGGREMRRLQREVLTLRLIQGPNPKGTTRCAAYKGLANPSQRADLSLKGRQRDGTMGRRGWYRFQGLPEDDEGEATAHVHVSQAREALAQMHGTPLP